MLGRRKPASKKLDIAINLVPKDPFFETFWGRSFKWALTVGRYIVIFTELVVIVSFATRFSLDRRNTDLNDQIHEKEQVLKSYGDLETKFRFIQQQITDYQQLQQEANIVEIFPILNDTIPQNVVFNNLTIRNASLSFSGVAYSQDSLNVLVNNMQLDSHFSNVRISKIESTQQSAGINFDVASDIIWDKKSK
ncbi:MAG: PilN domain-containing protein [Lentimicrobiaceae bacterium]|jgi:Tfp pilus assembly protein PilN|nr:PilN domain-containing protein [Lentimicrobiaceae bacterium]